MVCLIKIIVISTTIKLGLVKCLETKFHLFTSDDLYAIGVSTYTSGNESEKRWGSRYWQMHFFL